MNKLTKIIINLAIFGFLGLVIGFFRNPTPNTVEVIATGIEINVAGSELFINSSATNIAQSAKAFASVFLSQNNIARALKTINSQKTTEEVSNKLLINDTTLSTIKVVFYESDQEFAKKFLGTLVKQCVEDNTSENTELAKIVQLQLKQRKTSLEQRMTETQKQLTGRSIVADTEALLRERVYINIGIQEKVYQSSQIKEFIEKSKNDPYILTGAPYLDRVGDVLKESASNALAKMAAIKAKYGGANDEYRYSEKLALASLEQLGAILDNRLIAQYAEIKFLREKLMNIEKLINDFEQVSAQNFIIDAKERTTMTLINNMAGAISDLDKRISNLDTVINTGFASYKTTSQPSLDTRYPKNIKSILKYAILGSVVGLLIGAALVFITRKQDEKII